MTELRTLMCLLQFDLNKKIIINRKLQATEDERFRKSNRFKNTLKPSPNIILVLSCKEQMQLVTKKILRQVKDINVTITV